MKYFSTFPKLLNVNKTGDITLSTNIMARVNLIPSLLKNPLLFYQYNLQEGDNAESIANKYYDNPQRHWIFLYGNNIIDPQWDLSLTSSVFTSYLNNKYQEAAIANNQTVLEYTKTTIQYYQKLLTTIDSGTNTTTINAFNVDLDTYNTLPTNLVNTKYFPSGAFVKTIQSKQTINIYDYETELNESKRSVNIINKKYVDGMEQKLKTLMST